MRKNLKIILLVLVCLCLPNITVAEKSLDDIQEIGKQILKECNKVVITVKAVVVNQKYIKGGKEFEESENKMETQGIVLDSSGLTVIACSSISDIWIFEKFIESIDTEDTEDIIEEKGDIKDLKLVLEEGKEIPAKIVLVDKDLDLLFIRPEKEEGKFNFIEVDKIEMPQVLDKVFVIYRLTGNLHRQLTIFTRRIAVILKRPQTMYALDATTSLSSVVFNHQKKLIGITVMNLSSMDVEDMMMSVILPIEVIMDISKQAKESKEK